MEGDELYASSPLAHNEKVTGSHNPFASKSRTAHAISSREKTVDDEDENMSPTQSETNVEPRRDNFMAHEEGLSQIMSSPILKCPLPRVCSINQR
ncbi:hypothetical protein O181_031380 [Austropuccinia psidii MF-1]|uniref:Uncharacterized protein n=1 Tax=Austropuccinia psidii MF-1 TaxID=1389203 RepID=A0A9Q3H751_9BASI|nr:hypothetical protein [Austropuccinia psidii MF-1]